MSRTLHRKAPAATVLAAAFILAVVCRPAEAQGPGGRQWAVLIGCERYQKLNQLSYTVNDVRQLAQTLRERGGFERDCVAEVTDDGPDARSQPLHASLTEELPRWLSRPGPDDSLIVFFSGHGVRDEAGRLYLAPLDFDSHNMKATGVPVEWLRQLISNCKAKAKLLILDACHAGSEKGEDKGPVSVPANDLGMSFGKMENVVTLASSKADEKSQIWTARQQSLYSYWMNQGLKGHADRNGDEVVDIDELSEYVHDNVVRTAKAHFPIPQTPVRIVRTGIDGHPAVIRLRPQTLQGLLGDVAEQISTDMEERKLGKIAVLEFTCQKGGAEYLGRDYGSLGVQCAAEIEKRLTREAQGKFKVTNHYRLQNALERKKFAIGDLGKKQSLKELADEIADEVDRHPVIAKGTFRGRKNRVISLQCELIRTDSDELAGFAGGTAELSVDQWASMGISAEVKPEDWKPEMPSPDRPSRPLADQVIERADKRAAAPHPLADPSFPFPVRVVVDGKVRPMVRRGNEMLVPLRAGEVYAVDIENHTNLPIKMRMLVDGLDTLPHDVTVKGVKTEAWAQRVSLSEALPWTLNQPICRVSGFTTKTGQHGETRRFTVAHLEKASADRQQFTDQIGLITIAFYDPPAPAGSRGQIVTEGGDVIHQPIGVSGTAEVGNLRAVIHLRYVDADDLAAQ